MFGGKSRQGAGNSFEKNRETFMLKKAAKNDEFVN